MNTSKTLANRLKEILTEGEWVTGTNYKNEILSMDWKSATKTIADLNSVAQLTFHIHYYIEGVIKVFQGGPLDINDKFSFNCPPIESEKDWNRLTAQFCNDAEKLITLVEELNDQMLFSTFFDEKYGNVQRNIDLMIEHCYYHLGQIILIKKLNK